MPYCATGRAWYATVRMVWTTWVSRRPLVPPDDIVNCRWTINERRLFEALGKEARQIDEVAEEAGLTAGAASALLLTMELKGLIRNYGAQYYVVR